ncbi:MAG: BlaI/MecI/CopY family transcriptional regulator [Actinobacteria bacterium]|nr:BlaI/MecI/CopY family transcriptional regulator [Actinomycetota bacterium]
MVKIKKTKELSEEFGIKKVNSISDLETEIMKIMWAIDNASVREVHELMLKREMEKKNQVLYLIPQSWLQWLHLQKRVY